MFLTRIAVVAFSLCCTLFAASAEEQTDPRTLYDDATVIIKRNSSQNVPPEQFAEALFKLEKAQAALEARPQGDENLAQDINQALYWARKNSTLPIDAALDKLHGGRAPATPPKTSRPPTPPPPAHAEQGAPAELPNTFADARKAFENAKRYVDAHTGDDYLVALRWFQMANEFPDNDYAFKAIELARKAQQRFAVKNAPAPTTPLQPTESLPPEEKLIADGDKALAEENFDAACSAYHSSALLKDTLPAHRKCGAAFYQRGQKLKDALLPKLETGETELRQAYSGAWTRVRTLSGLPHWRFNASYAPYVSAKRKWDGLLAEAYTAIKYFDEAQREYKTVLRLAPQNRDLEAAGYIGLCMAVRGDAGARVNAHQYLLTFLSSYQPANDAERTLYAFCRTESERLRK